MVQSSNGGIWKSSDFLLSPCQFVVVKWESKRLGADSSPARLRAEGESWEDTEASEAEQREGFEEDLGSGREVGGGKISRGGGGGSREPMTASLRAGQEAQG